MWQQTLKKINHAVTPKKAAALWDADADSVALISDGINLIYRFTVNNCGKYLRITHQQIRGKAALTATIDYQCHLFQHNAPVCIPIRSKSDNYIEEIKQGNLIYLVHVVEEVPGKIMHFDCQDMVVYEKWGRALAKLHVAAKSYQPAANLNFMMWQDLQVEIAGYFEKEEKLIKNEQKFIVDWFSQLPKNKNNYGLIHGDHRTANVLYDGHELNIIDFDEPVYHWFLADVARPFLNICTKPLAEWKNKFNAYTVGYCELLPLNAEEINNLSWFIRMKNLDMYLWTKYNWHDPVAPGGGSTENMLAELHGMIINQEFVKYFEELASDMT